MPVLGWAAVEQEAVGRRTSNRYAITAAGRTALVGELLTDVLGVIADRCEAAAAEVGGWDTTRDRGLDAAARARFERMVDRYG